MIIDEQEFEQSWEATQLEAGTSSEKSVVILASLNEVDSVCATKIAMVRRLLAVEGPRGHAETESPQNTTRLHARADSEGRRVAAFRRCARD